MLFTRRQPGKFKMPKPLTLNGIELKYTSEHKHLGVHLNTSLDPWFHLEKKIKEGKAVIVRLASLMGKIWGLKPSMAMWLYKMVVRPIVCYASLIWHKAVHVEKHRVKLQQLQRFALMQLGYARLRTPGTALEVISHTMPLDLYILYDASCSYLRTKGHEKFTRDEMHTTKECLKGHRQLLWEYAEKQGYSHLLDKDVDDMVAVFNWDKKYHVDRHSWDDSNPKKGVPQLSSDSNLYTDGSRLGPYQSGAALSVWKRTERGGHKLEVPIPNHDKIGAYLEDNQIMQCELFGATMGANWLSTHAQQMGIKTAVINIDSQATLKALDHHKIRSKTALRAANALNTAASVVDKLTIRWVKAHLDDSQLHRGNHFADKTAKEAAMAMDEDFLVHPDEIPLPTTSSIKHEIYLFFVA